MNRFNILKQTTTWMGAIALSSLASLPALAQVNPRPSIFDELLNQNRNSQTLPSQSAPMQGMPSQSQPMQGMPSHSMPMHMNQGHGDGRISMLDHQIVMMAAQGNNAEIQTSQLALEKSQSETVRDYAQRMIEEHTLANQRLADMAAEHGMALPADPGPLNAAIAQELAQLSGPEFDRAYMSAQENAHLRTIALLRTAITQGQTPEVQAYASEMLPNVTEHYEMASRAIAQARAGNDPGFQ